MKRFYIGSVIVASLLHTVSAESLKDIVKQSISTNSEIQSNELKTKASKEEIIKEESGNYPTIDLDVFFEKSQTKDSLKSGITKPWENTDGYRATLTIEQLLYDGDKTDSRIQEKEYNYLSSKYRTSKKNEDITLEMAKAYISLAKLNEFEQLLQYGEKAHQRSLNIAYKAEEISGDVLETKKTLSLINTQNDKRYSHEIDYKKAASQFKKLTSKDTPQILCRPVIDEKLIPATLEDAVKLAIKNNYKIKEQLENIKKQSTKITQENANYMPTVKLKFDASQDNDIELVETGDQTELNGKITVKWNFYSGGRDESSIQKEKITLAEENKNLELATEEVVEKVSTLYETYNRIQTRIKNFKVAIELNKEILALTRKQLEDGTKTFMDELNAQIKLIDSQNNLIKQEFDLYDTYYELLNQFSILGSYISQNENQKCENVKVEELTAEINKNPIDPIKTLLEESPSKKAFIDEAPVDKVVQQPMVTEELPVQAQDNSNMDDFVKIFKDSKVTLNEKDMTITLLVTENSFTTQEVNPQDKLQKELDSFSVQLLKYLLENKNKLKEIKLHSYASSEFRARDKVEGQYQANQALSQRRANKIRGYFMKKAFEQNIDNALVLSKFNAIGHGSDSLVYDNNGKENKTASRRIVFKFIQ